MGSGIGKARMLLLVFPLLIAGSEAGQWVLDRFAPRSYLGAELLDRSNAGNVVPTLLALGSIAVAFGVGLQLFGSGTRRVPRWLFASFPPVLFAVQEHLEYWIGHGHLAGTVLAQPSFLAGLALQIPFAIAAYAIARLLLGLAAAYARHRSTLHPITRREPPARRPQIDVQALRIRIAGSAHVTRGPPLPSAL